MWIKFIDEKQHYACPEMERWYEYFPFLLFILVCFLASSSPLSSKRIYFFNAPKLDSIEKYLGNPIVKTNPVKFKIFDLVK